MGVTRVRGEDIRDATVVDADLNLDQPTIGNFINANHDHSKSDQGGRAATPGYFYREMQFLKNPGAATITTVGFAAAPTTNGTLATGDDNTYGPLLVLVTGSSNGNTAYLHGTFSIVQRAWLPIFATRMYAHSTITNQRSWFGLFSADPTGFSTPTTVHLAAFRYATDVDGTAFWRCVTCDGASNVTTTTTSVAYIASTGYNLLITCDASSVQFAIDDVVVATHTTNLPGINTLTGPFDGITTLTAASTRFRMGRMYLAHI